MLSFKNKDFGSWREGFGVVREDKDPVWPSRMYVFRSEDRSRAGSVKEDGSCYGFLLRGVAFVGRRTVYPGEYFQTPNGIPEMTIHGFMVVMQRVGYFGVKLFGGPVEEKGRLRYIDGCSDTLLLPPQVRGEPCLNLLHFPPGIDQTEHTHPSTRFGIVTGGEGECITPGGITRLTPGLAFHIPKDGAHKFRTKGRHMDVVAYHPDSDFGPTHETHPMVNRTLVSGEKIDNTARQHGAEVINPWLPGYRPVGTASMPWPLNG